MKMYRILKSLGYQTSHRFCGAVFCAAVLSVSTASLAFGQTKSITPDPYFGSSQATPSPIKKPSELTGGWQAPVNPGVANTLNEDANDSIIKAPMVARGFQSSSKLVDNLQAPSELSGFGLSPVQPSAKAPLSNGSTSKGSTSKMSASKAFEPAGQSGVKGADTGLQIKRFPEQKPKPRAKSLIVHANEQAAPQNSGSGSRQVDHREEPASKAFRQGKVLALVGGEPIFVGDLMFQINQIIEEKMAGAPEKIKEQQRQMAIPQLLPQFVESKLLYQGALRGSSRRRRHGGYICSSGKAVRRN